MCVHIIAHDVECFWLRRLSAFSRLVRRTVDGGILTRLIVRNDAVAALVVLVCWGIFVARIGVCSAITSSNPFVRQRTPRGGYPPRPPPLLSTTATTPLPTAAVMWSVLMAMGRRGDATRRRLRVCWTLSTRTCAVMIGDTSRREWLARSCVICHFLCV